MLWDRVMLFRMLLLGRVSFFGLHKRLMTSFEKYSNLVVTDLGCRTIP